ncbi:MAG: BrnA antitoxin family protein [Magnetospirillum sp.]|nr:BrnA antitoxin family protein [Magnetospirillum sp.]
MSEKRITRQSLNALPVGQTDWDRIARQSDEETNAQAASDPDTAPLLSQEWLARAVVVPGKKPISIRLDTDVLEFFQKSGKNYQTRINNVLRAYVEAHKKSA